MQPIPGPMLARQQHNGRMQRQQRRPLRQQRPLQPRHSHADQKPHRLHRGLQRHQREIGLAVARGQRRLIIGHPDHARHLNTGNRHDNPPRRLIARVIHHADQRHPHQRQHRQQQQGPPPNPKPQPPPLGKIRSRRGRMMITVQRDHDAPHHRPRQQHRKGGKEIADIVYPQLFKAQIGPENRLVPL